MRLISLNKYLACLFLLLSSSVFSQVKIEVGSGLFANKMSNLSAILLDAEQRSQLGHKVTNDFPAYFGYTIQIHKESPTSGGLLFEPGGSLNYTSSGGRVNYTDYSGSSNFDILASAWSIEINAVFGSEIGESFFIGAKPAIGIWSTSAKLKDVLILYNEEVASEVTKVKSENPYLKIGLYQRINIKDDFYLWLEEAYELSIADAPLHHPDNKDQRLIFESEEVLTDWSGVRLILGIGLDL